MKMSVELNEDMIEKCIEVHNQYRTKHGVPELKHNRDISEIAQKYADYLADNNLFEHSKAEDRTLPGNDTACGENLSGSYGDPGLDAADMWYKEIKEYDFNNQSFSSKTGHFTQLIWKNSTELGVGAAKNKDDMWVIVANYYPAGNVQGEFEDNVFPLLSRNEADQSDKDCETDTTAKKSGACTIL